MTILENNCMQSTASSAGYSTGGTLVSAFAAFIMLNGHALPLPLTLAWVFFLALLGVTMAVPMKKQMINLEQLRFPSGVAAAETLRALHSHGGKGCARPRPWVSPGCSQQRTISGMMVLGCSPGGAVFQRGPGCQIECRDLRPGLDGPDGPVQLGTDLYRPGSHHGNARLPQRALGQHRVLDGLCSGAATRWPHHRLRFPRLCAMVALAGRVMHGGRQPVEPGPAMAGFAAGLF